MHLVQLEAGRLIRQVKTTNLRQMWTAVSYKFTLILEKRFIITPQGSSLPFRWVHFKPQKVIRGT